MNPPDLPVDAALFLDFDGCLVEIAARPDAINVPVGLADLLDRLYRRQRGAVALISGRSVMDLRRYLPEFPGAIAGSHGAELALDGQEAQPVHDQQLDIEALHRDAEMLCASTPAILIEHKPHGVVLHYRADPTLQDMVDTLAAELQERFPGLALQPAKMAVELRPQGVGKDKALARLMQLERFAGRVPVYAGDDLTDEPAMAEAQHRAGFAIKIGDGPSCAGFRLPDPQALSNWLRKAIEQQGGAR